MEPELRDPLDGHLRDTFALVLSDVLGTRGVTITGLSAELKRRGHPVSVATLSYWQNGHSVPSKPKSLAALEEITRILGLPQRYLLEALPYRARTEAEAALVVPSDDVIARALRSLGLDLERRHTVIDVHDAVQIGGDRQVLSHLVRQLVRSDIDGTLSWPLIYRQTGGVIGAPRVAGVRGGQLVQQRELPGDSVFVGELALPRRMRRGEVAYVEYRIEWEPTSEAMLQRAIPDMARSLVLDVEFTGELPVRARYTCAQVWEDDLADEESTEPAIEVPVVANSTQHAVLNAVSGVHQLSWDWV